MTEFGHEWSRPAGVCIDSYGIGPFVVVAANGKSYRFEDSDWFGPQLINKVGDPLKHPWPAESSPFWAAHLAWLRQGRRVADDGVTCVWEPLRPTRLRRIRINRNNYRVEVIERGDPDGGEIYEDALGDIGGKLTVVSKSNKP
jgi:hypothetical protein